MTHSWTCVWEAAVWLGLGFTLMLGGREALSIHLGLRMQDHLSDLPAGNKRVPEEMGIVSESREPLDRPAIRGTPLFIRHVPPMHIGLNSFARLGGRQLETASSLNPKP